MKLLAALVILVLLVISSGSAFSMGAKVHNDPNIRDADFIGIVTPKDATYDYVVIVVKEGAIRRCLFHKRGAGTDLADFDVNFCSTMNVPDALRPYLNIDQLK